MTTSSPNIFSFATSELSQDAFFAWLLSFADKKYQNDFEDLHNLAQDLVHDMIHIATVAFEIYNINKVEVVRQYHNIDIMVIINDGFRILIESKTNSKQHDDQLARYYEFAKQQYDWNGFCLIYLKTGNESQYHINKNWENLAKISPRGYGSISRENLLNMFNEYKHIKNDIFQAYFEHLQSIQDKSNAYLTLPIKDWDHYCWQGFFMQLEKCFANPIWWDYVDNRNGGFWAIDLRELKWQEHRIVMAIHQTRLVFGIFVDDENIRSQKRNEFSDYLLSKANAFKEKHHVSLHISRPAKFGKGRFMKVAEVEQRYWLGGDNTTFDWQDVSKNLRFYEVFFLSLKD